MTTQEIIQNERVVKPSVYQEALQLVEIHPDVRYFSSLGALHLWLDDNTLKVLTNGQLVSLPH